MPAWADSLLPLVTALMSGLLVHAFTRRRLSAEVVASEAATSERLYALVSTLRADKLTSEEKCEKLTEQVEQLEAQLRRYPMVRISEQLKRYNGLARWFDRLGVPIVVSSSDNGGRFIYVSPEFCALLGRAREELIGCDWTTYVHPADLRRSKAVESSAWSDEVVGFVNRWRHADGSWVRLRWDCGAYLGDVSPCRVSKEEEVT